MILRICAVANILFYRVIIVWIRRIKPRFTNIVKGMISIEEVSARVERAFTMRELHTVFGVRCMCSTPSFLMAYGH
ncbi:hypothetical protein L4D15_19735 [Enterovibrio norvegicus]|uniref:hypothetical protein n=1 Tax=Enterovibrio norvegicus TaxID=188144 RepID=UPI003D09AD19